VKKPTVSFARKLLEVSFSAISFTAIYSKFNLIGALLNNLNEEVGNAELIQLLETMLIRSGEVHMQVLEEYTTELSPQMQKLFERYARSCITKIPSTLYQLLSHLFTTNAPGIDPLIGHLLGNGTEVETRSLVIRLSDGLSSILTSIDLHFLTTQVLEHSDDEWDFSLDCIAKAVSHWMDVAPRTMDVLTLDRNIMPSLLAILSTAKFKQTQFLLALLNKFFGLLKVSDRTPHTVEDVCFMDAVWAARVTPLAARYLTTNLSQAFIQICNSVLDVCVPHATAFTTSLVSCLVSKLQKDEMDPNGSNDSNLIIQTLTKCLVCPGIPEYLTPYILRTLRTKPLSIEFVQLATVWHTTHPKLEYRIIGNLASHLTNPDLAPDILAIFSRLPSSELHDHVAMLACGLQHPHTYGITMQLFREFRGSLDGSIRGHGCAWFDCRISEILQSLQGGGGAGFQAILRRALVELQE
jgi:hypothetical protein